MIAFLIAVAVLAAISGYLAGERRGLHLERTRARRRAAMLTSNHPTTINRRRLRSGPPSGGG